MNSAGQLSRYIDCINGKLSISKQHGCGFGLIAEKHILAGELIAENPAKRLENIENPLDFSIIQYLFVDPSSYYAESPSKYIMVCGFITFINHNDNPNCKIIWRDNQDGLLICQLVASVEIVKGKYLTTRYTDAVDYHNQGYF